MKINLLVIRTANPEILKSQYEYLGFSFDYHRHGKGPFHFASEQDGFVFEIYPLKNSMEKVNNSIRMGFDIVGLKNLMKDIKETNWIIKSDLTETEWGLIAVIQDLDGRKIELKNK